MFFVYILLCNDNSLYTGITNDIDKRIATHISGKGSKYVRSRLPVRLIYTEKLKDKVAAARREYEIKQWNREQKVKNLKLNIN